ncbi:hypothetical protein [Tahibacter sp.]|uniref:hypothetical protein n=1 Tax=Tahibacter sp. TaxID=2056211 RepID=UPI0028C3AB51|nr:hypothetical protein [Tahibacter sp.]
MFPRTYPWLAALALGGAAALAGAHEGPLDTRFGDGGMRHYGFQSVAGGNMDRAIVACSAANGTLTVVGRASSDRRIVTMRLLRDGSLDTNFSDDGKESFDLPGSVAHFVPGLCQTDGHMVVARPLTAPDGEQNVQIFRVLKQTGLPDPGFGSGGVVVVDLDQWIPGLGSEEMPLGVNALPNGDIAVSGRTTRAAGGERGFVILLAADGQIRRVAVLDNVRSRTAMTTVEAPDGRLWVFGQNGRVAGAYRATLNRETLAWETVLEQLPLPGETIWVGAGRAVDAQTVVLAVSAGPSPAYDGRPELVIFRADTVSVLALPPAQLDGDSLWITSRWGDHGVTVLPQRRVLYAAPARQLGTGGGVGVHFAMAEIGSTAGGDRVESSFGINGAQTAAFRPDNGNCVGAEHRLGRLTLWGTEPVFVGSVNANCIVGGAGDDYLVARIEVDPIFADGFD